eukprot:3908965-Alexandrium_andersonii.AAC.1
MVFARVDVSVISREMRDEYRAKHFASAPASSSSAGCVRSLVKDALIDRQLKHSQIHAFTDLFHSSVRFAQRAGERLLKKRPAS